ncbi:hypothetical protein C0991_003086 [Blastosporella zonata]|nr:hypothetical protein C0991_003086 [Blastosporella zonata]
MRFLPNFNNLPASLLLSSLALVSGAVPVHAKTLLTPDTFADLTASGLWFIEFFSPYCRHCNAFAPTWEKLVDECAVDTPQVNLAQVDCSLYGDLCNENGITAYPTMKMLNKGKEVDRYTGSRDLLDLHNFINRNAEAFLSPPSAPPQKKEEELNPVGEVLSLTSTTFVSTLAQGPMFVKFFAPWCGHCKKLAPTWKSLARDMRGKLSIVEVNCEEEKALCKTYNVQGYPTLTYITPGGVRSEYMGGRKLEQLKKFAEGASTEGVRAIGTAEVEGVLKEEEVVFLLIHSDEAILDTIKRASTSLLGSPVIYTVSDPALLARYDVPQTSTWALLQFKDHDAHAPASILHERLLPSSARQEDAIRDWTLRHRIPTVLELTQDTFQAVMNAPQAPVVVFAAVKKGSLGEKVEEKMREIGRKWRVRTGGSGETSGKEVVWAWMDAERWKDWMKSMYGVVVKEGEDDLDDVRVVVTDHKRLVYWDRDEGEKKLGLANSRVLFEAVEAAVAGKLPYKHSENLVERIARYLNTKMTSLEVYIVTYPWRTSFAVFMVFGVVFLGLRRVIRDDVGEAQYKKVERLD